MSSSSIDLSSMSMLEIFQLEAENQCTVLSDGLLLLEQEPRSIEALERLMRSAHSVKGAARIIGLDSIVEIAHAMEDVFVAAQNGECLVGREEIDTLFHGVDFLIDLSRLSSDALELWVNKHQKEAEILVESFQGLAEKSRTTKQESDHLVTENNLDQLSSSSDSMGKSEVSDSMMELFQNEIQTHCTALQDIFVMFDKECFTQQEIILIQKKLQSIKGVSKIVELGDIEEMAACMSDYFAVLLSNGENVATASIDRLKELIEFLLMLAGTKSTSVLKLLKSQKQNTQQLIKDCKDMKRFAEDGNTWPDGKIFKHNGLKQVKQDVVHAIDKTQKSSKKSEADIIGRSIRVSAEGMNRLMGLAGEVQVESRWLPDFALKMLRLKNVQDELYRLQLRLREKVAERDDELFPKAIFSALTDKIELCRNLFQSSLMEVEDHTRRSTEISHRLYHEVIANRMLPFKAGIRPFPRMVRDLCRELGKEASLVVVGDDTKVDRDVLEKIEAPLNHILRNALDHGVETPYARVAAGKPAEAVICLEARHRSGMLNIVITDDGNGIDLEGLRKTIVEKKMVIGEVAEKFSDSELLDFLFLPGFTTKESVSSVSGRGVGLDVVHSAIQEVRGIVRATTEKGQGFTIEMQLPITLSVLRALLIEINGEAYGFPLVSIDHVLSLTREKVKEIEGRPYITYDNERIGLISAQQIFDQKKSVGELDRELMVLIISDRHNSYGVIVDSFSGVRDLIVQPLDQRLGKLQDISAAAILEDGTPVLIVDVEDMVRSVNNLISGNRLKGIDYFEGGDVVRMLKRILVADDSITVREVERKMLMARGYEVQVAVDGIDALNLIRKSAFDLVVTDIDMPRMDGFELVTVIKQDPKLKTVPIIIVSYKDRPEDRKKGLYAGADYYLTKGSFQDETLVEAVECLIGAADEKL